jgi:hypothetical protein
VDLNMALELLADLLERSVQRPDDLDQGLDGRSVGVGNDGRGLELGARRAAWSCTALAWAPR